jgi:hypothetical protein
MPGGPSLRLGAVHIDFKTGPNLLTSLKARPTLRVARQDAAFTSLLLKSHRWHLGSKPRYDCSKIWDHVLTMTPIVQHSFMTAVVETHEHNMKMNKNTATIRSTIHYLDSKFSDLEIVPISSM